MALALRTIGRPGGRLVGGVYDRWLHVYDADRRPQRVCSITVTPLQGEFVCSSSAQLLAYGGRGSGKSHAMAVWALCRAIIAPYRRVMLVSPTFKKTEILWSRILEVIPSLDWLLPGRDGICRSARELRLVNGSRLRFFSADHPESLRGEDNDDAGVDERQEIAQRAVANVVFTLRRSQQYHLRQIGTPRIGTDFQTEYEDYKSSTDVARATLKMSSFDNPFISHGVFHDARSTMDERLYRQEVLGEWVPQNALVYWCFSAAEHVEAWRPGAQDITRRFCLERLNVVSDHIIGVDYPGHAVIYKMRDGNILHAIDEISITRNTSPSVIGRELQRKGYARSVVYDDASGSYGSAAQSPGRILRQMGFVCFHPKKNPHVMDRVNAVNSRLKDSDGAVRLLVDPSCRNLIRAFETQCFVKGKPDKSLVGVDDILDAAGYPIVRLFPAGTATLDSYDRMVLAG